MIDKAVSVETALLRLTEDDLNRIAMLFTGVTGYDVVTPTLAEFRGELRALLLKIP